MVGRGIEKCKVAGHARFCLHVAAADSQQLLPFSLLLVLQVICFSSPAQTISETMSQLPATMKASQFSSTAGGLEKHLKLNPAASPPRSALSAERVSVEVISMSLNPVDYKVPELPLVGGFLIPKPASPGIDY